MEIGQPKDGVDADVCKSICDADPECNCVTYQASSPTSGTCWKRTQCVPAEFERDAAADPYTVYVNTRWRPPPKVDGGALVYLKHDSMGPYGDAALMVFNPGEAQTVTVDLSLLPANLIGGKITPYDLFTNETADTPLSSSWSVAMRAGEAKALGGFSLGVYAPKKGKVAGCASSYSKVSSATTLQQCFLDCAAQPLCDNVLVYGTTPRYTEAPSPITCTLLGSVDDSTCTPGECNGRSGPAKCATLIRQLDHARPCAHLWPTPTQLADGAPAITPGWPCKQHTV